MPVLYKPFQSVLEDKNKKKLFHPRVIYTANVSTTQLAKEIAAYSSLSTGDVKNSSIPELYVRETWIPHNFRKK